MSGTSFHDTDVPLFTGDELAELRRIEQTERAREAERLRLRREGERLARETRARQGLSEHVEVELWGQ